MNLAYSILLGLLSLIQIQNAEKSPVEARKLSLEIRAIDMHGNVVPNTQFTVWHGQQGREPFTDCEAGANGIANTEVAVLNDADLFTVYLTIVNLSDQQVQDMRGAPIKVQRRIRADVNKYSLDIVAPKQVVKLTGKVDCSTRRADDISQSPARFGDFRITSGLHKRSSAGNDEFTLPGFVTGESGSGFLSSIDEMNNLVQIWEIKPQGASEFDCGTLTCMSPTPGRRVQLDPGENFHRPSREYDFYVFLVSDTGTYAVPIESDPRPSFEDRDVPAGTYYVVPCSFSQLGRAVEVIKSPTLKTQLDGTACPKIVVTAASKKEADAATQDESPVTHTFSFQDAWDAWDKFIDPL